MRLLYCIFWAAFLFTSCAQMVAPTGGIIDRTPPKILASTPTIGDTNYSKQRVEFEFDEYVQVQNLAKELIVSPPLKNPPSFLLNQKKLVFTWEDEMLPNTTYYFNFGQSISDINEGNKLDSNIMVFSTGPNIDSLTMRGKVLNAFNLKPEEEMFVMLYPQLEDSIPSKLKPTYFAKTDKQGSFEIKYIKDREYQIFALKDNNANYLFDLPNEKYAFQTESIKPIYSDSTVNLPENVVLLAFEENLEKQYLKEISEEKYGKLILSFNLPVNDSVEIIDYNMALPADWAIWDWSEKKDSLSLWIKNVIAFDTLNLQVSLNELILDSATIILTQKPMETEEKGKKTKNTKPNKKLNLTLTLQTPADKNNFGAHESFEISANHPIIEANKSLVTLWKDSIAQEFTLDKNALKNYTLETNWMEDGVYQLEMQKGAFVDFYGNKSDSVMLKFKAKSSEEYGFFYLNTDFENPLSNYIIELYQGEKLIQQTNAKSSDSLSFEYLKPGNYELKAIEDTNHNGKWDTGNYGSKTQSEKIFFFNNSINIRANWETIMDWVEVKSEEETELESEE